MGAKAEAKIKRGSIIEQHFLYRPRTLTQAHEAAWAQHSGSRDLSFFIRKLELNEHIQMQYNGLSFHMQLFSCASEAEIQYLAFYYRPRAFKRRFFAGALVINGLKEVEC